MKSMPYRIVVHKGSQIIHKSRNLIIFELKIIISVMF